MIELIQRIWKTPELRIKLLVVFGLLVVFRFAAAIPVPGIDTSKVAGFIQSNQIFGLLNLFTGGSLESFSIVMLGVGPYITATIIFQLFTMIFPKLKKMYYEEGERGRQRFNQYARIITVPLAILQAYSFLRLLESQQVITLSDPITVVTDIFVITAGTILLMWLGELISEKGIGNGISMIIFAGIVGRLPVNLAQQISVFDPSQIKNVFIFVAMAIMVIVSIVIVTEATRPIRVQYSRRAQTGATSASSSFIPLKVNQAGVIPIIFAVSLILLPSTLSKFLEKSPNVFLANLAQSTGRIFSPQGWTYNFVYFFLVIVFTFFYTTVAFNTKQISEMLMKQGGFLPGIRPGTPTKSYLDYISLRVTLFGAIFLGLIAILPSIAQKLTGLTALLVGGTGILIVVSVVLETTKQIESQLMMSDYESLLIRKGSKKYN